MEDRTLRLGGVWLEPSDSEGERGLHAGRGVVIGSGRGPAGHDTPVCRRPFHLPSSRLRYGEFHGKGRNVLTGNHGTPIRSPARPLIPDLNTQSTHQAPKTPSPLLLSTCLKGAPWYVF